MPPALPAPRARLVPLGPQVLLEPMALTGSTVPMVKTVQLARLDLPDLLVLLEPMVRRHRWC